MMSFLGGNIGGFLSVFSSSSINKADFHDITEILLKMALMTNNSIYCIINDHFFVTDNSMDY